ncbi:hypothetical protein D9M70_633480 [compost metagenome]
MHGRFERVGGAGQPLQMFKKCGAGGGLLDQKSHIRQTEIVQGFGKGSHVTSLRVGKMFHNCAVVRALKSFQHDKNDGFDFAGRLVVVLFQDLFDGTICIVTFELRHCG